jgi:hypothetical protein
MTNLKRITTAEVAIKFSVDKQNNLHSNVHMAYVSNSRAMAIFDSILNVMTNATM